MSLENLQPKKNLRGNELIRGGLDAFVFDDKDKKKVIGLKPAGEKQMRARDIFSNEERNDLDFVRWLKAHDRS